MKRTSRNICQQCDAGDPTSVITECECETVRARYMLVYQVGIANVFRVSSFNLADYGRDAVRVLQHAFGSCEWYARGLAQAGAIVRTVACNMAGDITHQTWTDDLTAQPFADKFNPVFTA